ncbi:hypothetical protein ACA910_006229 [Epithemia clementina (nom. ined.)]
MFRRRFQANGGGGGGGLPTTSSSSTSSSSVFNLGGSKPGADGSARSIHVQAPVITKWKRSSRAVKTSYMVCMISFLVVVFGWRSLSHYHAKIHLDCSSITCTITARAVGSKAIKLSNIPRNQVLGAKPVKVNAAGVVVNHNVNINEEWKYEGSNKKKKGNSNNYKGPDKDGNYLTYVVMLQNKDPNKRGENGASNQQTEEGGGETVNAGEAAATGGGEQDDALSDFVDLSTIMPLLVRGDDANDPHKLYLVLRQQGIAQARRRVRTMVQKVDSYAKRRRHKLLVKENTAPDWKAVLMLVFGGCTFLISLLLALFWEEDEALAAQRQAGPGARRRQQQQQQQQKSSSSKSSSSTNPYQRTIPARYEVSTTPKKAAGSTMRRRN